jgi:cell wall-associated NlpC family hydrolase
VVAVEEQLWVQLQLAVRVVAQVARAEQPLVVAVEEQLWVQPQLVVLVAPAHRF